MHAAMRFHMIDAIGPFFIDHPGRKLNWSKIPFAYLERDGKIDEHRFRAIRASFARFADTVAAMGFTAVSLDDLAHLTDQYFYSPALRRRVAVYRREFGVLFDIARDRNLKIYLTTDVAFFNAELQRRLGRDDEAIREFLAAAVSALFRDYPAVEGLIVRFGEADGLDGRGDFISRIVIRTPGQAQQYIRRFLKVCEHYGRNLVVRTWTLGAHPIGDLMWNPKTYTATFGGLHSDRLIISMKYGETDFFRYVPLNPHFRGDPTHFKIVELQTRREYEGFGEYPAFIGWEYSRYARQLRTCRNVIGTWIWCQTGGWTSSRRITFVKNSSIWNEVNTAVTLALFQKGLSVEEAIRDFCGQLKPPRDPDRMERLLRLSSEVVRELLYIDEYARRAVYFRRLRLPPLLYVFWDTVLITDGVRRILRHFTCNRDEKIRQGEAALAKLREMIALARELELPVADVLSQYDTYEILAAAREYYFGKPSAAAVHRLETLVTKYRRDHPGKTIFVLSLKPLRLAAPVLRMGLAFLLRRRRPYRLTDKIITLRLLSLTRIFLRGRPAKRLPEFVRSQGMGLHHFIR
jgi:hypothetical protein